MAWGGRHLVIGFAAGAIPKVCHLALSASHLPTVPPDDYATVRTPRSRSTSACSKALRSSACTAAFPDPGRVACALLIPDGFHGVLKLSVFCAQFLGRHDNEGAGEKRCAPQGNPYTLLRREDPPGGACFPLRTPSACPALRLSAWRPRAYLLAMNALSLARSCPKCTR